MKKVINKVAIFCDFFNSLGGTEYYNFMLARSLKQRGIDVKVFIGERPKYKFWLNLLDKNNIEYFYPKKFHKDLACRKIEKEFIKKVIKVLRSWQPNVIHSHPPGKMLVSFFEAKNSIRNIPVIVTEWTTPSKNTAHWYPPELNRYINEISAFIATCEKSKQGIIDYHNFKGNIYLLPHLINAASKLPEASIDNIYSVGVVSRLSPEKGLDYLLGAWMQVVKSFPDATLHIYGHGDDEQHLRSLVKALGIYDKVIFEGIFMPITGIDEIAKKHSIFVQPSLFESIPTSIIELMARKKAIIATDVGGIPELINEEKQTGIIVNPASTEQLFKAIIKCFSNPNLITKFGESAYKEYLKEYDLNKTIDKLVHYYEIICKEGNNESRATRCSKK